MADAEKKEVVTGLETAHGKRKDAEYDLVKNLLEAADFKNQEDAVTEVEIRRNGKHLFTVRVHPIGDPEARLARKKATTYMPNPTNKKLPPVEKSFDAGKFNAWVIYLATVEEDQRTIWGNPAVKEKYSLNLPAEGVDVLLTLGEKDRLVDTVLEISGMGGDEDEDADADLEDYAGN